jgi:hypothetical protein
MRTPAHGPNRRWQKRPHEVENDSLFVAECLRLWDLGINTKDIALKLFQPEHIVHRAMRIGREHRRGEQTDHARCDGENKSP